LRPQKGQVAIKIRMDGMETSKRRDCD